MVKDATWQTLMIDAVRKHKEGRTAELDIIARLLQDQEDAKRAIRLKGYGHPWVSFLRTVDEVPEKR